MKRFTMLLLWLGFATTLAAQNVTLSGYLKDASNGEALIGATIYVEELKQGTASNAYGFYSLTIPEGTYSLQVSFIGYETKKQKINANASQTISVSLNESSEQIEEIVVSGEAANANVERIEMGMAKLPIKTIKKLPAFMGEVDIIKTIQLLPGIQSGGEASSGLYVRGGGPDENLMILDEAPVYNASHLMGFFSVFNSDAIKDIQVYKSGIPAEYGGKGSSVIDIRQKDGNSQRFGFEGGIGNLSSRLTLEGPIIKDKWSFILAGRRTYYDVLGKAAGLEELKDNKLYFYDLNAKSNLIINKNNRIYLSGYMGDDVFEMGESMYMRWGNATATLRWNHIFGDKIFMNVSGIFSNYDYNLGVPGDNANNFDWSSRIRDYNAKVDFTYFFNPSNTIKFGTNTILHHFRPGKVQTEGENSMFSDMELAQYNAVENAVYLSNEQKVSNRLTLQYGLRLSHFQQVGKGEVNIYQNPDALKKDEIIETKVYKKGDKIGDAFVNLEPRFGMKYTLGRNNSVKSSYNRMVQNLHLITNTQSPTPLDVWLPSSTYIKPLIVDQVSIGYFHNLNKNMWETSVELYYKNMQNVLDYREGAELFLNDAIETELLHGSGESKGMELLIKKSKGDLTGWIGYTWSKTTREIEGINNGNPYPSSYDRTHDLSVVSNYELNKRWNFAANFVFATGSPTSYPVAKYNVQGNQIYEYSARNSNRIPEYHRLDISATYDFKKNANRRFKQSLNFSIYNVYARRNAYSITPEANEDNPNQTQFVRISIIGSAIPSITYNVKF
uniref:TonB-dependent receptor n=1 Tax=uncultured Draconibacterium sp. TaxID=1573823 RepID=UPI003217D1EF